LAYAIEIRVVELARQVVAGATVADREIFAAEERGGICERIGSETAGDTGERAWRRLFVQDAVRV
jgi:hypothetical protein